MVYSGRWTRRGNAVRRATRYSCMYNTIYYYYYYYWYSIYRSQRRAGRGGPLPRRDLDQDDSDEELDTTYTCFAAVACSLHGPGSNHTSRTPMFTVDPAADEYAGSPACWLHGHDCVGHAVNTVRESFTGGRHAASAGLGWGGGGSITEESRPAIDSRDKLRFCFNRATRQIE